MARLSLEAQRQIRGYEPVFRSMLTQWLESHMDATGNVRLTLEDVSAGVAHVFTAISQGIEITGGDKELAMQEYRKGKAQTWKESINGLCQMAT